MSACVIARKVPCVRMCVSSRGGRQCEDANLCAHLWNVYSSLMQTVTASAQGMVSQANKWRGSKVEGKKKLCFYPLPSNLRFLEKNVCFSLIPQNVWFVLTTDAIRMSCHCVNLRLMKAALDSELLVLLHGPKNRRPKWTQMISRCLFRQQGFGAGASCPMQMIITSVLWHLRQQHRRLIHVRHFIMWAWGILHFPNLWHATQAMAKDACDHRKPAIFLMPRPTRWHDLRVC